MPYHSPYKPDSDDSYKLSRSGIESFVQCPRCFYLGRKLGISQPGGFPFNLNSAVDHLLKKEFDIHRAKGEAHPLMEKYGIAAVPYQHEQLDAWRYNFTGAVDDIWMSV